MKLKCPKPNCGCEMNVDAKLLTTPNIKVFCIKCKTSFAPNTDVAKADNRNNNLNVQQNDNNSTQLNPVNVTSTSTQIQDTYKLQTNASLIVHSPHAPLSNYEIGAGKSIIGRKDINKPCQIMIPTNDLHMSRNHFIITANWLGGQDWEFLLADCNALNYTFINKEKLQPNQVVVLKNDDLIQAGDTHIYFKITKSTDHLKTELLNLSAKQYLKTELLK